MTEISSWCNDHPEAWVEEFHLSNGVKLEMELDLGHHISRVILYTELLHSKIDIIALALDDMFNQLSDDKAKRCKELAELNKSVDSTGFKPIELLR